MKKVVAFIAALMPTAAFAHGPADVYYLVWWHLALVVFLIGFVIFASCTRTKKAFAAISSILVTVLAWATLGNIHSEHNTWQSSALSVALSLAPVTGFVLGFFLARTKTNAI